MARQKIVITKSRGKVKRLVRRGWIVQAQSAALGAATFTLVKPAKAKKEATK